MFAFTRRRISVGIAAEFLARGAFADGVQKAERVEVTGHYDNSVGSSDAASAGVITPQLIDDRPLLRPGNLLKYMPGSKSTSRKRTRTRRCFRAGRRSPATRIYSCSMRMAGSCSRRTQVCWKRARTTTSSLFERFSWVGGPSVGPPETRSELRAEPYRAGPVCGELHTVHVLVDRQLHERVRLHGGREGVGDSRRECDGRATGILRLGFSAFAATFVDVIEQSANRSDSDSANQFDLGRPPSLGEEGLLGTVKA